MSRRRLPVEMYLAAGLVLLVGALATLQYQWLGQVSDADRAQLLGSLKQRAADFARDLDREIAQLYSTFQSAGALLAAGDLSEFASRYDGWLRSPATRSALVRGVYRATSDGELEQYQPSERRFEQTTWPPELVRLRTGKSEGPDDLFPMELPALTETFLPSVPALVVPLPSVRTLESAAQTRTWFTVRVPGASLVVWLDRDYLTKQLVPSLAERYFPAQNGDFRFAIVDARDPGVTILDRGLATGFRLDPKHADAVIDLLSTRPDLADSAASAVIVGRTAVRTEPPPPAPSPPSIDVPIAGTRTKVIIERRMANSPNKAFAAVRVNRPAWLLVLQHVSGSLDTVVTQARRRNLALSFGILALLATSVGMIVVNAQRARRLASQQMDFVATVSHELRTPLAVIRSAAQNLSAGVVDQGAQARRYGDLIEGEGRRLTEMVEQILQFAGLAAERHPLVLRPVDIAALARDVILSSDGLADGPTPVIEVEAAGEVPMVAGDEEALRRALRNLLVNACKYGANGGWIGVSVGRSPTEKDEIQLVVRDRGRGIDPEDLPHLFEPFYRGRHAVDRQIRGNGLGLALVKRIAEAHGGAVTVQSTPGHGATFTLHLPAAMPDPAIDAVASPAAHPGAAS